MNIKNKTIVITGASEGIGKSIALRLAQEHVKLILIARNESKLKMVADAIKKLGSSAFIYPCDISDTDILNETANKIIAEHKIIEVLINNAGVWQQQMPLEHIKPHVIENVINTNLTALIKLTHSLLPVLKIANDAAIINIVSKSGVLAQAGQTVYTASKYGARGFTEVLKEELKETNIKVAGIYQSGTDTDMFRKVGDSFDTSHLTQPDDLANVVSFMLMQPKNIWLHDVRVSR
ncbi:MAG: SDR family oxidoreductase [Gammaproteobacteria bacterium]|nr:SDR family oxidoreductase [Gammaproteobacteria bacterium]